MATMVFGRDREVAAFAEQFLKPPMGALGRAFTLPFTAVGVADKSGALTGAFVITDSLAETNAARSCCEGGAQLCARRVLVSSLRARARVSPRA